MDKGGGLNREGQRVRFWRCGCGRAEVIGPAPGKWTREKIPAWLRPGMARVARMDMRHVPYERQFERAQKAKLGGVPT